MNFLLSKSSILIWVIQLFLTFPALNISSILDSGYSSVDAEARMTFNQQFLVYQGYQTGAVVQEIMRLVSTSNQTSEYKINMYLNENPDFTENDIVVTQKYNIYFHYGNEGYIDAVMINPVQ